MVEAEAGHGARAEVVGYDVGFRDELEEGFLAPGGGHVETEAALVAGAVIDQAAPFVPPFHAGPSFGEGAGFPVLQVIGAFDADDLGAVVGQESGAPGKGMDLFQREDPDTVEYLLVIHRVTPGSCALLCPMPGGPLPSGVSSPVRRRMGPIRSSRGIANVRSGSGVRGSRPLPHRRRHLAGAAGNRNHSLPSSPTQPGVGEGPRRVRWPRGELSRWPRHLPAR